MKTSNPADSLADAIAEATQKAAETLFAEGSGHHFYYFTLITDGEGHAPFVSAWSHEALEKASGDALDPKQEASYLKWSYADSPYCFFGEDFFSRVTELFAARPEMTHEMSSEEWRQEFEIRVNAMEQALRRLDESGVFGRGEARLGIVINVEVVPPDHSNTQRAQRLNPPSALPDWLVEIAEPTA